MKEKATLIFLSRVNNAFRNEICYSAITPEILGYLFANRMQGVAYDNLVKSDGLKSANREVRNTLRDAHEWTVRKNENYTWCVSKVSSVLREFSLPAAMVKGAYLHMKYPAGCRTANDIDLLMRPEDISPMSEILAGLGFEQGYIRNDSFSPATRREIIESRVMRGETVPFVKEINLPYMKYLEIDINFSLDYKNTPPDTLSKMLNQLTWKECDHFYIPTLQTSDFFLHLCAHLYKEATTLPWIQMGRDMTLYKYCDIDYLIREMTEPDLEALFSRAEELDMLYICSYAIAETMELFCDTDNSAYRRAMAILDTDPGFRLRVVDPKSKKTMQYLTPGVRDRFFMKKREENLKEVIGDV